MDASIPSYLGSNNGPEVPVELTGWTICNQAAASLKMR